MADITAKRDGRSVAIEAKFSRLAEIRRQTNVMIQEVLADSPETYQEGDFMFKEAFNETV